MRKLKRFQDSGKVEEKASKKEGRTFREFVLSIFSPTYETPTFGEAFRKARIEGVNNFNWNNHTYNTELIPNPAVEAARKWDTNGDLAREEFRMEWIRDPNGTLASYKKNYPNSKKFKTVNERINNYDFDYMYTLGNKDLEPLISRATKYDIGDQIWDELQKTRGLTYEQKLAILANSYYETAGWSQMKQVNGPASGAFMMEEAERQNYNNWLKEKGLEDSVKSQTRYVVSLFKDKNKNLVTAWDRVSDKTREAVRAYKSADDITNAIKRSVYNHMDYTTDAAFNDWNSDNLDDTVKAFEGLYERAGKPEIEKRQRVAAILSKKYTK